MCRKEVELLDKAQSSTNDIKDNKVEVINFSFEQKNEISLKNCFQAVNAVPKQCKKESILFQLKNGVLTRCFDFRHIHQKQIVLPIGDRYKVLDYSHDIPCVSHFGDSKTIHRIWE